MTLKDYIKRKSVLFIPVYSARSHETGIYNLEHDGNFARIVSLLKSSNFGYADVLVPLNSILPNVKIDNVNFVKTDCYGSNAKETRDSSRLFIHYLTTHAADETYDIIVSEPNALTSVLCTLPTYKEKIIYWCVASVTNEGTPWFVQDYEQLDKYIAKKIPTAVANEAQKLALKGRSFVEPEFYRPEYFTEKVIYFPFRLTDKSYHAKEFAETILKIVENEPDLKFKVFYPDMNDCGLFDELNENIFVKVPANHSLYLQLLKSKPIIPYLENSDLIEHISIHEFQFYECPLIMFKPKHKTYKNAAYIGSKTLYELLLQELRKP